MGSRHLRQQALAAAVALAACLGPGVAMAADADADAAAPADVPEVADAAASGPAAGPPVGAFCFFATQPAAGTEFVTLRRYRKGKQTYGSVLDLLPAAAAYGRRIQADGMIDYDAAQRFGFLPWRMVRPVVQGTFIRWKGPAPDCAAAGGRTLDAIQATKVSPGEMRAAESAASAPAP